MDFNLTNEQQMLRDAASRYVREQCSFEAHRHIKGASGWSPERWAQYADMGWLALSIPEDCGGLGCGFVETAIVAEELGRGLVLEPFVACTVLAARLIERAPEALFQARRAELLKGMATGKVQVALAHSEAGNRFEVDHVQARAHSTEDGWELNGVKIMVPAANAADHFIVSASTGNALEPKIGLWLVPRAAVTLNTYALIDGTRASDVTLASVLVPPDNMLAAPGTALPVLEEALDRAALALVAEGLGCMEAVLEMTSEYIKTRHQYGQAIGKFQALQHRMAEMFVDVQETRSILYRGMTQLDEEPASRRLAVSAAKVMLGNAGRFVGGQGIQLHGGIGVTEEYQVGHFYKRLLVLEKLYGDSDWHLGRFAEAQP